MGQYVFHHTLPLRVAVPSAEFLKKKIIQTSLQEEIKGYDTMGVWGQENNPPPGIYLMSIKCFKMSENEGNKAKKSIHRKQKYIYINLKFCYKYDWVSG